MSQDLYFEQSHKRRGFETEMTAKHTGDSHPVIRELIQNALDARVSTHEPVEVEFLIKRIKTKEIPHIETYQKKLELALDTQQRLLNNPGKSKDKNIEMGEQMLRAITQNEIDILFCRDNGIGITPETMEALLGEGVSYDKDSGKAGSYGLGHLQAFGASGIRYILYAGRYEKMGEKLSVASGHAILASFQEKEEEIGYAPEGYLLNGEIQSSLFEQDKYLTEVPDLLNAELDKLDETGSVVAIMGFNNFREADPKESAEQIQEVCAINFFIAIEKGWLIVNLKDSRDENRNWQLDKNTIGKVIDDTKNKKMAYKSGMLSGSYAKSAYDAFKNPENRDSENDITQSSIEGSQIYLRKSDDGKQQIHIFRNGMWITRDDRSAFQGSFSGINPIHCVILVQEEPSRSLIRKAEGVLHVDLDQKRFIDADEKQRFRLIMKKIKDYIVNWAGEQTVDDSFIPDIARFQNWQGAKQSKPQRPKGRKTTGYDIGERGQGGQTTKPPGDGDPIEDPDVIGPAGETNEDTKSLNAPKPGNILDTKTSYIPILAGGRIAGVKLSYLVLADGSKGVNFGIQIYKISGSDISCDRPPNTEWVPLPDSEYEFLVKEDRGVKEILFSNTYPSETQFGISVVKRKNK